MNGRSNRHIRVSGEALTWLATAALAAAGSLYPTPHGALLGDVLESLVALLPVVVLAALLAAAVTLGSWSDRVMALASGNRAWAVVLASAVGTVTPVCGLGVLPLIAALLSRGLSLPPVMAFWIASPVMDPPMAVITVGIVGLDFAVAKAVAAFGAGLLAGSITAVLPGLNGPADSIMRPDQLEACHCRSRGFWAEAWNSARLVLRWLVLALVLEILLQRLVPDAWILSAFGAGQGASVPLAALVGAPLYVDGYAALPLVRGLMDKGMGFGPALAFMISGAAVSLYAAVAVAAVVRLRVFGLYVALAVLGAIVAGWTAGWIIR